MAHIHLCFVWHMHQPFYKDLVSGEYKLPWTRMHALKDYYGMVKVLEDFPEIHQTFNLVPSMMVQVEEYASGAAFDSFLRCALKPAEQLDDVERNFILRYFFQANVAKMIYRYPRYRELYETWSTMQGNFSRAPRLFGVQAMRDLQVLSQLAWFDEEFLTGDPEIAMLVKKERDYSLEDQAMLGRKQQEVCGKVIPIYAEFARRGQIELSTTPFYHPILPLLCDTHVAEMSHPHVPLPPRFRYPEDARVQLDRAYGYMQEKFGYKPAGFWPSEGSVSDEALHLAAECGFQWFATDNGVLARTLHQSATAPLTYRPYLWKQGGHQMRAIFRDHYLSDLIGFVYARMNPSDAAGHFLDRIRENCHAIVASGRDALVPIILDGENAWEYYDESGRPFLRELYRRISNDRTMSALTVSEALAKVEPHTLESIFPGSWINANFDVWIGAEEDNKAWDYLLQARQTYERVMKSPAADTIPEERKKLAYEELLIAEGSDWNWWYGPEHDSANRPEFDQLFRDHLANVYLALRLTPPEDLSRPILRAAVSEFRQPPTGPVRAKVDGLVTSYFEWLGAGSYRVDNRSGAMHGKRYFVEELHYGTDGDNLFVRLDFVKDSITEPANTEVRLNLSGVETYSLAVKLNEVTEQIQCAYDRVCELSIPLKLLGYVPGQPVRFQLSLWSGGLPMDALPPQGWLEVSSSEPLDWVL